MVYRNNIFNNQCTSRGLWHTCKKIICAQLDVNFFWNTTANCTSTKEVKMFYQSFNTFFFSMIYYFLITIHNPFLCFAAVSSSSLSFVSTMKHTQKSSLFCLNFFVYLLFYFFSDNTQHIHNLLRIVWYGSAAQQMSEGLPHFDITKIVHKSALLASYNVQTPKEINPRDSTHCDFNCNIQNRKKGKDGWITLV